MKVLVFSKEGQPIEVEGGWPSVWAIGIKRSKGFAYPYESYIRDGDGRWYRSDLTPWREDQLPAVIKTWLLIL